MFALFCLIAVRADTVHVPKPGSAERKAIMDAIRLDTKAAFKGKDVVFLVAHLKVHNGWAWVMAEPQDRKSGQGLADGGEWLLQLKNGSWKCIQFAEILEAFYEDGRGYDDFVKKIRKTRPEIPADIF